MKENTNIKSLCGAVNAYKHDARTSKNPYKKEAYKHIKKIYDGLKFFEENLNLSCGALLPYIVQNNIKH